MTYLLPLATTLVDRPVLAAVRGGAFRVLFVLLLAGVLFAPNASSVSRAFRSRPMVWLGKYSYGLYVYHHFFAYFMIRHGTEFMLAQAVGSHTLAVWLQAAAGIALSMVVAWASYHGFEKRFLDLKRRWPTGTAADGPKDQHAQRRVDNVSGSSSRQVDLPAARRGESS
jgi:peptidoglycan/LPS O-acetylase OafA/YrhL